VSGAPVAPTLRMTTRRVIVTGAAHGIGRATLLRLAAEGAAVGALDLDPAALEEVVREAGADSPVASAAADVSDPAATEGAVRQLADALGGLDGLANVAGTGGYTGDVTAIDLLEWRRQLAVNLDGPFHAARAAIPIMRRTAERGAIVNISSQYGLVGCHASPAYCAAKAGLIGLTRAMAVDHSADGVRVNCVCPGATDTRMLAAAAADPAHGRPGVAARSLADRPATPEEVAATIVFLLSDEASYTTGSVVTVDGGWTAW
jgi:NAD(P)-dependent dehydrogenase (short-subunit alcohol dehydrogenase family)